MTSRYTRRLTSGWLVDSVIIQAIFVLEIQFSFCALALSFFSSNVNLNIEMNSIWSCKLLFFLFPNTLFEIARSTRDRLVDWMDSCLAQVSFETPSFEDRFPEKSPNFAFNFVWWYQFSHWYFNSWCHINFSLVAWSLKIQGKHGVRWGWNVYVHDHISWTKARNDGESSVWIVSEGRW